MIEDILNSEPEEEKPKRGKTLKNKPHRFDLVNVSKLPYMDDELLTNRSYVVTKGKGLERKPLFISIPYPIYELVPRMVEFLNLVTNYGEVLRKLKLKRYNSETKLSLEKLVKESEVNLLALEQVIRDEVIKAMTDL